MIDIFWGGKYPPPRGKKHHEEEAGGTIAGEVGTDSRIGNYGGREDGGPPLKLI